MNVTKHIGRKPSLKDRTDRAWFNRFLWQLAWKWSGCILSIWSPQGAQVLEPTRTGFGNVVPEYRRDPVFVTQNNVEFSLHLIKIILLLHINIRYCFLVSPLHLCICQAGDLSSLN